MIPNGARMRRARPGQRGYVTARWLAPIRLVAALLIVVGLAVSVPPSFGTVDGDHVGLLLHPLFPHAHGSAESLSSPDDRPAARDAAGSLTADADWRAADQVPGIRGPVADAGFRSALSGIVLPTLLAGVLFHFRQLQVADARRHQQHWRGPPAPPPRALPLTS